MRNLFSCVVSVVTLFGLAGGCQKKDSPPAVKEKESAKPDLRSLGEPPAGEDPEVVDYAKKQGWLLHRDIRIRDQKPVVYLGVENRDKPFEEVALSADDYKMIARSKTVQMLNLRNVKNTDDGLKTIAGIPQLEDITVKGDDVTDVGVKALAQCKSLEGVVLITKNVTDAGVKELAAMPKLRSLFFMFMTLDGSAFEAFAGSKALESVTLENVDGFTDEGAKHLAKLSNLNELKIGSGFGERKLTAAGIKAIVDARLPAKFEFDKKLIDDDLLESLVAKGWLYGPTPKGATEKKPAAPAEVKEISLRDSKVTDKGLRAILNCTNATSLHLQRTGVTDETLKHLSAFKKLDYLALEQTKVTAVGLDAISGLPIRHIEMEGCELSEDAFRAFAKMTALEELWLTNAKMRAEWLKHISTLPKLKDLNLMQADFDDAAAKHVATLPNLESLTLNSTKLGDAGFQELLKMPKLRSLLVDGTKVSKEVYQKAKQDHPNLSLYYYRYDQ